MTFLQAFLCGVIYWIGNNSFARGYFVFSKPLVAGFLVGLVFGQPLQGAMIGAEINMIYLGWIGAGGASPADPCAAGVLSTAFVLATGLDMDAALVLAVPVGLVAIALYTIMMTVLAFVIGVLPLVWAHGAGAVSRISVGSTVFGGMLAAGFIGTLLTPGFYVIVQSMTDYFMNKFSAKEKTN